jgi:signal transduction histidine kinase
LVNGINSARVFRGVKEGGPASEGRSGSYFLGWRVVGLSRRSGNIQSFLARYALSLLVTAIALLATLALRRDGPTPSFLFFVPAVAISAWYGGPGPSALATALSLLLIDLNFLEPGGSLSIDRIEALEIIAFLVVSVTITSTMEALHRSRSLAESRAAELKRLNVEVGRSYDAERERRHVAELLAHTREEVLGVVAHDLRNPLNLIITSTDLLFEENLDRARRKELMGVTLRAARQMNRLIGDLLDTVRLQAGKFTLDLEDVTVAMIFRQAEEAFRPLAAKRSIELDAIPPDDGIAVRADPLRVSQIVGNIVGNAIKFTPEGGIVTMKSVANGNHVAFHVTDTGPGIAPNDMGHLFDNFWQARRNDHRGVGLGLAIAKGVVEAHGGKIWCDSVPGRGSTFSFSLPRAI